MRGGPSAHPRMQASQPPSRPAPTAARQAAPPPSDADPPTRTCAAASGRDPDDERQQHAASAHQPPRAPRRPLHARRQDRCPRRAQARVHPGTHATPATNRCESHEQVARTAPPPLSAGQAALSYRGSGIQNVAPKATPSACRPAYAPAERASRHDAARPRKPASRTAAGRSIVPPPVEIPRAEGRQQQKPRGEGEPRPPVAKAAAIRSDVGVLSAQKTMSEKAAPTQRFDLPSGPSHRIRGHSRGRTGRRRGSRADGCRRAGSRPRRCAGLRGPRPAARATRSRCRRNRPRRTRTTARRRPRRTRAPPRSAAAIACR